MKALGNVLKLSALVGLSGIFLWILKKFDLIDFELFFNAFRDQYHWSVLAAIFYTLSVYLGVWRFVVFLKIFHFRVTMHKANVASFVSLLVGQWLPGSLVVADLLRIGLIRQGHKKVTQPQPTLADQHPIKTITLASLLERFVGQAVMFLVAAFATILMIVIYTDLIQNMPLVILMTLLTFGTGMLMLGASFILNFRWLRTFLKQGFQAVKKQPWIKHRLTLQKGMDQFYQSGTTIYQLLQEILKDLRAFSFTLVLSLAVYLTFSLSLWFTSFATGQPVPFISILITSPILMLAFVLPIGFAGIGGQQMVVVAIFSLFQLAPETISSASLVHSTIILISNTLLGVGYLLLSSKEVLQVWKNRT